jgi:hypothetical protein
MSTSWTKQEPEVEGLYLYRASVGFIEYVLVIHDRTRPPKYLKAVSNTGAIGPLFKGEWIGPIPIPEGLDV